MATIRHPFGALDASSAMTATGAQAVTISNQYTIIDGVTVEATANRTLNLTLSSELESGAILLVKSKTNGTETLTFGTGITSAVITGVAGKTMTQGFIYDANAAAFLPLGVKQQID